MKEDCKKIYELVLKASIEIEEEMYEGNQYNNKRVFDRAHVMYEVCREFYYELDGPRKEDYDRNGMPLQSSNCKLYEILYSLSRELNDIESVIFPNVWIRANRMYEAVSKFDNFHCVDREKLSEAMCDPNPETRVKRVLKELGVKVDKEDDSDLKFDKKEEECAYKSRCDKMIEALEEDLRNELKILGARISFDWNMGWRIIPIKTDDEYRKELEDFILRKEEEKVWTGLHNIINRGASAAARGSKGDRDRWVKFYQGVPQSRCHEKDHAGYKLNEEGIPLSFYDYAKATFDMKTGVISKIEIVPADSPKKEESDDVIDTLEELLDRKCDIEDALYDMEDRIENTLSELKRRKNK